MGQGKLSPWLARHGLDALTPLWQKLHVQAGWENALEAALRERLGALEVSQVERVLAFADDVPPSKLAFYSAQIATPPASDALLPPLADLLPGSKKSREKCGAVVLPVRPWLPRIVPAG